MNADASGGLSVTAPAACPSPDHATHTSDSLADAEAVARVHGGPAVPERDPKRYQILGEHGRGGLGRVSRAHDVELGRDVAIKELISRGNVSEVRFLREALITARLEHPGIVPVHEAGRWPDGTPFYAMKLVAGRSLHELLAGRHTVEDRIGLLHHVIAVADAIAYAHGRNIIHRDLKPANVIVGDFGETVVIDWGLAKDLSSGEEPPGHSGSRPELPDDGLTSAGTILGTPAYMAPEQARGDAVDQRADVYAIGAMLWELCARERLPPSVPAKRIGFLRRAGIDEDLTTIIDKALATDPARRYPDAGVLAADLRAFKAGARIAARRYSLLGMLAHWTRRHRGLALTGVAAVIVATTAALLYMRSMAAAGKRTEHALAVAQRERDRAVLSEASLLLAKDPARSRERLADLTIRSPQYALVMNRAMQGAAKLVLPVPERAEALFRAPHGRGVALLTMDGALYQLDPRTGTRQLVDRSLDASVTYHAGEWLYTVRKLGSKTVTISTKSRTFTFDTSGLGGIKSLASLDTAVYALDTKGDVYQLTEQPPRLVHRRVHNIAGDHRSLLVCSIDGTLDVIRDGVAVLRRRCPRVESPDTIGVIADSYATLNDSGVLTISRNGQDRDIDTPIHGDHELALSDSGMVALADYGGDRKTWFVAADATHLESGPPHASKVVSVAAGGDIAAWGYADGAIIAVETTTGATWELIGHPNAAGYIAVFEQSKIVLSMSSHEVRIWHLESPPVTRVAQMPCSTFNFQVSPDHRQVALDCSDGRVWAWSPETRQLTQVHHHSDLAFSVQWLHDMICSGGWDGQVLCSTPDGKTHRSWMPNAGRIVWLAASPGHDFLVVASADGRIWRIDDRIRELYSQEAVPYRVAIAPGGTAVASCDLDGSVVVFDLVNDRIASRRVAHAGAIRSIGWRGDVLWTAGADGWLRWWQQVGSALMLRSEEQAPGPLRLTMVFDGGWVSNAREGELLISTSSDDAPLRLDLDRRIDNIDRSPDGRYLAASVLGDIVVVDLLQRRLATLKIDTSTTGGIGFIDGGTLAISASSALKTVHVESLIYTSY